MPQVNDFSSQSIKQCSGYARSWGEYLFIFMLGSCFAFMLQYGYAHKYGFNLTRLLHVVNEADNPISQQLAADFDNFSYSDHWHDAVFSYLQARQPFADSELLNALDGSQFRYRRLLYSLLAGGAGHFSASATLWGLIFFSCTSYGLALAAYSDLLRRQGASVFVIFGFLICPGLWVALTILTSDLLALALVLNALLLYQRGYLRFSLLLFAMGVLTKEVYWLVPAGLAARCWFNQQKVRGLLIAALAALPQVLWTTWLFFFSGLKTDHYEAGDFTWPLHGIWTGWSIWPYTPDYDHLLSYLSLLMMIGGLWVLMRPAGRLIFWLTLPWMLLGLVLSDWIWTLGNNSQRDLLPVWLAVAANFSLWCARRKQKPSIGLLDG